VATSVSVDVRNDLRHFGLGELQSIVVQTLHQFIAIQPSVSVVVHDSKRSERHTGLRVEIGKNGKSATPRMGIGVGAHLPVFGR